MTNPRKKRVDFFIIGVLGIILFVLGSAVSSTRVFMGLGPAIYRIPTKHTSTGWIMIRLDAEVYLLEVLPSFVSLFLTTTGFGKETLRNVTISLRFPRPQIRVHNSSGFRLSLSMLLSSWGLFFLWAKAFLGV